MSYFFSKLVTHLCKYRLMKKILLFTLLTIKLYGQINSGEITYQLTIGYDKLLSEDKRLKLMLESAQIGAKQITKSLVFNNESSLFTINKGIDDNNIGLAKAFTGADNIYYTMQKHDTIIKQVDNNFGQYIISFVHKKNWLLSEETKLINNYLCYKATSTSVVVNSSGTFKFPIIAWYCPSIPFNYGPNGYNGLPGVILEFQERNISYGAIKIKLNKDNIIIPKPDKGKKITEEQYKNIITKQRETIKNQN